MLTAFYSKSLVGHHLNPSSQLCRNCCSRLHVKAAFSRQVCLTIASQFQLFRWSLGNRCICLRLKPLCPYYMRYCDPFIISYKKSLCTAVIHRRKIPGRLQMLEKGNKFLFWHPSNTVNRVCILPLLISRFIWANTTPRSKPSALSVTNTLFLQGLVPISHQLQQR